MLKSKSNTVVIYKTMKIVICDDEAVFVNVIESQLRNYAAKIDLNIEITKCRSARELLSLDLLGCDVLFLDIDMPEINGITAAREIRKINRDVILVFVTGWIEYAPAGYQVNAFRYLLKTSLEQEFEPCMEDILARLHENAEMMLFQTRDRTLEISLRTILYLEGTQRRSVLLYLYDGRNPIECTGKLAEYDERLCEKGFLRLQKSYLANMDHIVRIKNYIALLRDGTELKVSERQYAEVKKQFLMWKGRIL